MRYDWMDGHLLAKMGVTKDIQPDWNWIRYHVGGKMFAAICLNDEDVPVYVTLKLEPTAGEFWRGQYEDVIPGYYMNKEHWSTVIIGQDADEGQILQMIADSYNLTKKKTRKRNEHKTEINT